jgi:hypothetical protein
MTRSQIVRFWKIYRIFSFFSMISVVVPFNYARYASDIFWFTFSILGYSSKRNDTDPASVRCPAKSAVVNSCIVTAPQCPPLPRRANYCKILVTNRCVIYEPQHGHEICEVNEKNPRALIIGGKTRRDYGKFLTLIGINSFEVNKKLSELSVQTDEMSAFVRCCLIWRYACRQSSIQFEMRSDCR